MLGVVSVQTEKLLSSSKFVIWQGIETAVIMIQG